MATITPKGTVTINFNKGIFTYTFSSTDDVYQLDDNFTLRRVLKNGTLSKSKTYGSTNMYVASRYNRSYLNILFIDNLIKGTTIPVEAKRYKAYCELIYKASLNNINLSNTYVDLGSIEDLGVWDVFYSAVCQALSKAKDFDNINLVQIKEDALNKHFEKSLPEYITLTDIMDFVNSGYSYYTMSRIRELPLDEIIFLLKAYNQLRNFMDKRTFQGFTSPIIESISMIKENVPNYKCPTKGGIMDIVKKLEVDYKFSTPRNKNREKVNKSFAYNQTLLDLSFENDKFKVIVPTTYEELLTEGENQNNCAAHFEWNHYLQNGIRRIVFIRKKECPNESYITCDIDSTGRIQQYLQHNNKSVYDNDALDFKYSYQNYLFSLDFDNINPTNIGISSDALTDRKFYD